MGLIKGEVKHEYLTGAPLVVKAEVTKTTNGGSIRTVVAFKLRVPGPFAESEASMTGYVSTQSDIVPQFIGCYNVYNVRDVSDNNGKPRIVEIDYSVNNDVDDAKREPKFVAIVSDFVDGVSLDKVWSDIDEEQQNSIKKQLGYEVQLLRKCQQSYIGCINHQQTVNPYKRALNEFMGPFDSEVEFDKWCLSRNKSQWGPVLGFIEKMVWKWKLKTLRGKDSNAFVLTHGDLAARNIIVRREEMAGMVGWKIAGIVDWEHSGFFPEWAEYAIAKEISGHEEWWEPVLLEVLEPFKPTERRLKFQALLVQSVGWLVG